MKLLSICQFEWRYNIVSIKIHWCQNRRTLLISSFVHILSKQLHHHLISSLVASHHTAETASKLSPQFTQIFNVPINVLQGGKLFRTWQQSRLDAVSDVCLSWSGDWWPIGLNLVISQCHWMATKIHYITTCNSFKSVSFHSKRIIWNKTDHFIGGWSFLCLHK